MNLSNTFHLSVHQIFEDIVQRHPDQVALISQDKVFTYSQLNEKSNQLANYLKTRLSIQTADILGVLSEPDEWIIISILAILKCGAAYMPLSPRFPQKRIDYMMDIADTKTILCSASWKEKLPDSYNLISFDSLEKEITRYSPHNLSSNTSPDDLAYIMFTSGTTGNPNGVEIPNRGIVRLVCNANYFPFNQSHTFLQLSTVSFDASTFEIWGALLNGNKLVLYPDLTIDFHKLESIIANHSINCLFLTTSLFNLITEEYPACLEKISFVLTGGEIASVRHIQLLQKLLPNLKILNVYGPTESTTFASCYSVPSLLGQSPDNIPIGKVIDKTQLFILNDDLTPTETGETGELFIGGEGLALGYRKQENLTREKFIEHPISPNQNLRLYRTGDLCRYNNTGDIEFVGRKDNQCKIRGFRVETAEIELVIKKQNEIRDCLVIISHQKEYLELIAYITGKTKSELPPGTLCKTIDDIKLKAEIQQWLPDYMLPSRFIELNQFPLNDNMKIDRTKLPDPQTYLSNNETSGNWSARELKIKNIWMDLFPRQAFGPFDDFFELGGNSLHCIQMIYRLNEIFHVAVPIKEFMKFPTIKNLDTLIDQFPKEPSNELHIKPFDSLVPAPLSPTQQTLWVFHELNPGSNAYNVAFKMVLLGELNTEYLEIALNELIYRQEALRTSIKVINGKPMQLINPFEKILLDTVDVTGLSEKEADALIQGTAMVPFDLGEKNLIRWKLFRRDNDKHILFFNVHHVCFDGWSLGVFNNLVSESYNAKIRGFALPAQTNTIRYRDYTYWQWEMANSDYYHRHIAYWKQKIGLNPEPTELTTDFERPAIQSFHGDSIDVTMENTLFEEIKTFAKEHRLTLYLFLVSCFHALLFRYTHKRQITIGSPYHNRSISEIQDIIGYFTNNLLLSVKVSEDSSFLELLGEVRSTFHEAIEFQSVPFDLLIRQLVEQHDPSRMPLFQILFVLQNAKGHELELDGLSVSQKEMGTKTSKFDLSLICEEVSEGLNLLLEYNTDLFERISMQRFLMNYLTIIKSILQNPTIKISELDLIHPDEMGELLTESKSSEGSGTENKTIHRLFEEQAEKIPQRTAIHFQGTAYSYEDLNNQANLLANHLKKKNPYQKDKLIGVMMERSEKLMIAMLAIFKSGGAYFPIDFNLPARRIMQIIEESPIQVILCDNFTENMLREIKPDADLVNVISYHNDTTSTGNPISKTSETDLACCLFSSAREDKPRVVLTEHKSILNLIEGVFNQFGLSGYHNLLSSNSLDSHAFILESLLPLVKGLSLVMADETDCNEPDRIASLIDLHNIEIWQTSPSRINSLLIRKKTSISLQRIRVLILGGEILESSLLLTLKEYSRTKMFYVYGSAETSGWSTYKELSDDRLTIGKPIQNNQVYVLDRNKKVCPSGVPGELVIGGIGLARGYLNDSKSTLEKFIPNPFFPDEKVFLSGEIVRRLWNHELELQVRQVEKRTSKGIQTEFQTIEKLIKQTGIVNECLITVQSNTSQKELVIYLVLNKAEQIESNNPSDKELRLKKGTPVRLQYSETSYGEPLWLFNHRLFEHELTGIKSKIKSQTTDFKDLIHFMILSGFPYNHFGKIDKLKLPIPSFIVTDKKEPETGSNRDSEAVLLKIWKKILLNDQITVHDDFFELGGYSLLAVDMIYQINKEFNTKLTAKEIFSFPTIFLLAKKIVDPSLAPGLTDGIFMIRKGDGKNIFLAPGLDGNPYLFADLQKNYKGRNTLYSFEYPKTKDKQQLANSMQELAMYFIHQIFQIQSTGRYNFAGFCFGGRLIFEIGIQLQKSGKEVGLMAIIDTMAYKKSWTQHYRINLLIHELFIFKKLTNAYKLIYLKNRFKYFLMEKIPKLTNKYFKRNITNGTLESEEFLRLEWHRYVMHLLKNYCPEVKFKGDILLYKEENHLYPIKEELHYINLVYPDLYWKKNIDGQIKYVILDCEHLDFFKPKNVHKILDPIVEYFTNCK